jgi:hypothetical protein
MIRPPASGSISWATPEASASGSRSVGSQPGPRCAAKSWIDSRTQVPAIADLVRWLHAVMR